MAAPCWWPLDRSILSIQIGSWLRGPFSAATPSKCTARALSYVSCSSAVRISTGSNPWNCAPNMVEEGTFAVIDFRVLKPLTSV